MLKNTVILDDLCPWIMATIHYGKGSILIQKGIITFHSFHFELSVGPICYLGLCKKAFLECDRCQISLNLTCRQTSEEFRSKKRAVQAEMFRCEIHQILKAESAVCNNVNSH